MKKGRAIAKSAGICAVIMLLTVLGGHGIGVRKAYVTCGAYGSQYAWVYRCNRSASKTLALTFDDGPHPKLTEAVLDVLREYRVPATFFVVGENAEHYPELLRQIVSEGHEIGNHTFNHIRVDRISKEKFAKEISSCASAIQNITGVTPKLFRPPEGAIDENLRDLCEAQGYRVVLWSIDTEDWRHTPSDVITKNVLERVKDGDIILMHDYIGKESPTPEALKKMIPALLARGYRFVLVSDLLRIGSASEESEVNQ